MVMENSKVLSVDVSHHMDYRIPVLMVKSILKTVYKCRYTSTQCTAVCQSTQPLVKMVEGEQNIGIVQNSCLM